MPLGLIHFGPGKVEKSDKDPEARRPAATPYQPISGRGARQEAALNELRSTDSKSTHSQTTNPQGRTVSIHDPKGIILGCLKSDPALASNARETLFAWLMALPGGTEPSIAANDVLARYHPIVEDGMMGEQAELIELLRQVQMFDRTRHSSHRSSGRRRAASLH